MHSDEDISTDVSSPVRENPGSSGSEDDDICINEADKQILEWASKLEIESIQVREKSTKLINLIDERVNEMHSIFNEKLSTLKFDNVIQLLQDNNAHVCKWTELQKKNDFNLEKLNFTMNDFYLLLLSLSKEVHSINEQIAGIKEANVKKSTGSKEMKSTCHCSCHHHKDTYLDGTTISNSEGEEIEGPITRSKSVMIKKSSKPMAHKKPKPVTGKWKTRGTGRGRPRQTATRPQRSKKKDSDSPTRNTNVARTIIPWEELDDTLSNVYSSEL
ncbi:hypothetical protein KAFR_0E01980 [Kazachstania africana CBS 2517]|uniref:Uncharacterized protein n=1 Tax=Kazachstania africana (strain ATCC 22294 / BCRC 22015 / CBS 2517 / CECT 1963 / NBRC 1671 / NRRL Y-8276) TaxID=1071382 RepID=H2AVF1_KAZAF|nr:hypothetical protein KAFR_0E01980 [Kazachstania africana CBS 2517]CCF58351.1 hypothetical protein KAFR_0E01980 [Kazachstania africana CBS 2517]